MEEGLRSCRRNHVDSSGDRCMLKFGLPEEYSGFPHKPAVWQLVGRK
jgi:hypothetical protein